MGERIRVILDCDDNTLAFERNYEFLGVAFRGECKISLSNINIIFDHLQAYQIRNCTRAYPQCMETLRCPWSILAPLWMVDILIEENLNHTITVTTLVISLL